MSGAATEPRPTRRSPEVVQACARALLPRVVKWLGSNAEDDGEEGVICDLVKALEWDQDAYSVARHLDDRCGWSPDAELIDILDGADLYSAERDAVRAWVARNGIRVDFQVGQEVVTPRGRGAIKSIEAETASVTVYIADHAGQSGSGYVGTIFAAELCALAEAA